MKIDFLSEIPCSVFYGGKQFVTPFTLNFSPDERIQLGILPSYPEKYLGYTLIISIENDKITSISGGGKAICWGGGISEIILTPPFVTVKFSPVVLAQKKVSRDLITLYDDGQKKVMCEGSSFYTFDLPQDLDQVKLKVQEFGRDALVLIEGRTQNKDYLLSLYSNGSEWKIMHEILATRIQTTPKGVKSFDVVPSMLRLEKRAFYEPFILDPTNIDFVPTIRHAYPTELIPYLFFEGVILSNPTALDYLDPTLPHDLVALREFLGDFDSVEHPHFGDYDISVVAIFNSKLPISHPDLYKIEVENNKITNIIHLLTCN